MGNLKRGIAAGVVIGLLAAVVALDAASTHTQADSTSLAATTTSSLGAAVSTSTTTADTSASSQVSSTAPDGPIGQRVSPSVLDYLASVSLASLSRFSSAASTAPLESVGSSPVLTLDGKPETLYMGAEYCPYCAAERWALIVALDQFGSFTGLEYMESSSTDVYPDTSTFTFVNASYASSYIAFVAVEELDRSGEPLQPANASETAQLNDYDRSGSIPFVDFAGEYALIGAQYSPEALRSGGGIPYGWDQIASQLNNASSPFARNIDGAAAGLVSAICETDGGQPASVCTQQFAGTLSYPAGAPGWPAALVAREDEPESG